MTKKTEDQATATASYLKGLENGPDSLFWLRRAQRLAPDDPRITLEIARRELQAGSQNSAAAFEKFKSLSETYDTAPAWIGLAIAAQLRSDAAQAAKAIDSLLSRHCLPDEPDFAAFAAHIAGMAGYDGYQAYQPDGTLIREGKGHLLGAQTDQSALTRVEGLVEWHNQGLRGWAVRPAWPDEPPSIVLQDADGHVLPIRCGVPLPADAAAPFLPRYRFKIPAARLARLRPPFSITGADGTQLMGSPLTQDLLLAQPVPANSRGKARVKIPKQAPLALLMPVYRGLAETQSAINSCLKAAPAETRFIVVNDASPEPDLVKWLEAQATRNRFELISHTHNQGFCAAVNTGLAAAKGCDVLLLNSDILLPPKTIATLREIAYAHAATGSVTPLSNEATICSYPSVEAPNEMPDLPGASTLARLALRTNGLAAVEIPTAIGFCMYIRHDCLKQTGNFRAGIFAQGYGEENDFCLRARHLGYRHMAAMGAYVAHKGGVSFRSASRGLMSRNLTILNQLFPGYAALIAEHVKNDPAAPYRAALDEARLLHECKGKASVLLISHAHGGGVAKQIEHEVENLQRQGVTPLLLTTAFPKEPERTPYPWPALLCLGKTAAFPNLSFTLPQDMPKLLKLLRLLKTESCQLHHMLGQHEAVRGIAARLNVPMDIIAHDYASFCPRVNLLTRAAPGAPLRYCGEPDLAGCVKCCAQKQNKKGVYERLPVAQLLDRSRAEFSEARSLIVPSADMAKRLIRHFPGVKPRVSPWEDDAVPISMRKPRPGRRRIAIIGGIGPAKGLDVLLDCARDAKERQLPLEFVIIGSSANDSDLIAAGIKITGPYRHNETQELIASLAPDLAFLPSIWPETWGFVLSEAWRAGLYSVVFDLGAQAERVRATGRGLVLPLGLPSERINHKLLSCMF